MIKRVIKKVFRSLGYNIVPAVQTVAKPAAATHRVQPKNPFSMEGALQRAAERGVKVNSVIDIGASNGMWSEICLKYFPDARYLLIEAQEPHRKGLEAFTQKYKNVEFEMAAAGEKEGKIYFDNSDLFGGLASETPLPGGCIEVNVTSIDAQVKKHNLKPPFLIKLDTHGFEMPILNGGNDALENTSLLIIEQYNYQLTDNSLLYFQLTDYLFKKGFFSVDIVDLLLRPKDNTFWQMDVFYQPISDVNFDYRSYK